MTTEKITTYIYIGGLLIILASFYNLTVGIIYSIDECAISVNGTVSLSDFTDAELSLLGIDVTTIIGSTVAVALIIYGGILVLTAFVVFLFTRCLPKYMSLMMWFFLNLILWILQSATFAILFTRYFSQCAWKETGMIALGATIIYLIVVIYFGAGIFYFRKS